MSTAKVRNWIRQEKFQNMQVTENEDIKNTSIDKYKMKIIFDYDFETRQR